MTKTGRVISILMWLGALMVAGAIILTLAASRVGEHKSSTYGNAYNSFQQSWGGPIGVLPPEFSLARTYDERVYNSLSKEYETKRRVAYIDLVPRSIHLDSEIVYGEQTRGLLSFNAFEVRDSDTYEVVNNTDYVGALQAVVYKPESANLVYEFTVEAGGQVLRPTMGEPVAVIDSIKPGETATVQVRYATKGMDYFKYKLSNYQNKVVEKLTATIRLNTDRFEVYRFGLPHTVDAAKGESQLTFTINDFSTTQDLGVTFDSMQQYLDQIQSIISYSPISLALYLVALFMFTQIRSLKFNAFHYLFIAAVDVFYFLFVSYLIRYFGLLTTFGVATALTAAMFLAYCPNVLGWRFATRVAAPYLFALTVVFSLIFLMPIFRGILFVVLVFAIFLSVMIPVSRSDLARWPVVLGRGDDEEKVAVTEAV